MPGATTLRLGILPRQLIRDAVLRSCWGNEAVGRIAVAESTIRGRKKSILMLPKSHRDDARLYVRGGREFIPRIRRRLRPREASACERVRGP